VESMENKGKFDTVSGNIGMMCRECSWWVVRFEPESTS